jgi:UDP-N-acetyl-D-mannosaminuronic acid dehydrogenase
LVNDGKPQWVVEQVKSRMMDCINTTGKALTDLTVACLGLAFKADIDDLRESPALQITRQLTKEMACNVVAVEPNIKLDADCEGVNLVALEQALAEADVVVLLVEHQAFKQIDVKCLEGLKLVDTRGIFG